MKKILLFIALAAIFCFSYSALAEPSKSPVAVTTAQSAGTVTSQQAGKVNTPGISRVTRQKVRPKNKNKIFENSARMNTTTSGFV